MGVSRYFGGEVFFAALRKLTVVSTGPAGDALSDGRLLKYLRSRKRNLSFCETFIFQD